MGFNGYSAFLMDENCEKRNIQPYFDKFLAFEALWCPEKELPPGVFVLFLNFITHISRIILILVDFS